MPDPKCSAIAEPSTDDRVWCGEQHRRAIYLGKWFRLMTPQDHSEGLEPVFQTELNRERGWRERWPARLELTRVSGPPPPSTGVFRVFLRTHRPLTSTFGRRLLCLWGQFVGSYSTSAQGKKAARQGTPRRHAGGSLLEVGGERLLRGGCLCSAMNLHYSRTRRGARTSWASRPVRGMGSSRPPWAPRRDPNLPLPEREFIVDRGFRSTEPHRVPVVPTMLGYSIGIRSAISAMIFLSALTRCRRSASVSLVVARRSSSSRAASMSA